MLRRFPRLGPMLVLAVLIGVLDVATARGIEEVSAVDELNHIDYLVRGSDGEIGRSGVVVTQETLRELCARGSDYYVYPDCPESGPIDPARYFAGGENRSGNPPGYYVVTGPTARVLRAVLPGDSLVTWARVLGALWLLAGCYLVLRISELLGLDRWLTVAALVFAGSLPVLLHASTTVNPDAAAFLVGAAILFAVLAWERRRDGWRLALIAVTGFVALTIDPSNGVAVLIALGYLGVRAVTRPAAENDGDRRGYAWAALVIAAGAAAGLLGWEVAENTLDEPAPYVASDYVTGDGPVEPAPTPVADPGFRAVDGIPYREILEGDSVFGMFPPVDDIAPPPERASDAGGSVYRLFAAAAVPFVVAALLVPVLVGASDRLRALALATVVSLLVAPILLQLHFVWSTGSLEESVPRLAISALPGIVMLIVGLGTTRAVRTVIVVLAGGLYLGALASLL